MNDEDKVKGSIRERFTREVELNQHLKIMEFEEEKKEDYLRWGTQYKLRVKTAFANQWRMWPALEVKLEANWYVLNVRIKCWISLGRKWEATE